MRHSDRTVTLTLGSVALTASVLLGAAVATASGQRDGTASSSLRPPTRALVESSWCDDDDEDDDVDDGARGHRPTERPTSKRRPSTTPLDSASSTVSVTVPQVAMIRLDRRGRVVWASTNTGCAPAIGDLVYVVGTDGSLTLDPTVDVTAIRWRGDFRDGRRAAQSD